MDSSLNNYVKSDKLSDTSKIEIAKDVKNIVKDELRDALNNVNIDKLAMLSYKIPDLIGTMIRLEEKIDHIYGQVTKLTAEKVE